MDDYPVAEFIKNVQNSHVEISKNINVLQHVQNEDFEKRASRLSLFPSWLIDDDIFSIIPIVYGATDFVHSLMHNRLTPLPLTVKLYIVPRSVVSLYDSCIYFNFDLPKIVKYLVRKKINRFERRQLVATENGAGDICSAISELYDKFKGKDAENVAIIFDRRDCQQTGLQEVVAFEHSTKWSVAELEMNNLIRFDLEILGDQMNDSDNVARAYLNYGTRQRIRFYPEFMVSVFAKLFVTPSRMTEYEFIKKLYSTEYKKGWNLNLEDQRFNDIYKAITGTDHETNNYYRDNGGSGNDDESKFGFFRFVQRRFADKFYDALTHLMTYWKYHSYDSDTVIDDVLDHNTKNGKESNIGLFMKGIGQSEWVTLRQTVFDWKQMECGTENVFNVTDCTFIQRLMENLKRFKERNYIINMITMKHFNLSQIIGDFDHLVSVHNMFNGDDTVRIQRYIANQVDCEGTSECLVVNQFRNRRRENEKHSELDRKDNISSECAVLRETLCEIHCYLLHRSNELYRLSSESEGAYSKFTSLVKGGGLDDDQKDEEKKEEPLSIDFGISVLRWLRFGEKPVFESLRDEMVHNKDSTLTQEDYDRMEIECTEKIKNTDYSLNEMMSLKFFTDLSKFTASLRMAHWESMPSKMRKRYYQWARVIHRAALRHAVPIPIQRGSQLEPQMLFHGLSKLFRMDRESPTYFGPFPTTLSRHVANTFTKKQGLRLHIKSGYGHAMKRCLGINVQRISCFKREQEVLLVDQPLPIQSAKTWDSGEALLIDHFLYSLKSRKTKIRDPNQFYKKLGVKYQDSWTKSIAKHGILHAKSEYGDKLVIQRLVDELGFSAESLIKHIFDDFIVKITVDGNGYISVLPDVSSWKAGFDGQTRITYLKCYQFGVQPCTPILHQKFTDHDHMHSEMFKKLLRESQQEPLYRFNSINESQQEPMYRFNSISEFAIPLQNHVTLSPHTCTDVTTIDEALTPEIQLVINSNLYGAPAVAVKTLRSPFISAVDVQCQSGHSLSIDTRVMLIPFDESTHRGGKVVLTTNSSVTIGKEGGINGSSCGLRRGSNYGNRCYLKYGQFLENTEERNGSESDYGAGGGLIVLNAVEFIVNYGVLLCEASDNGTFSGGTISINTDNEFVNNGIISSGRDGMISVFCRKFVNEGQIESVPTVQMMESVIVKQCVDAQAVKEQHQRMEMDVVDHRGHYKYYHPRHLLQPGYDTEYFSGDGPPEKDWIIFSAQTVGHYITSIGIRNYDDDLAIKRISIEGSADNKEYEHWMEIGEIEKGMYGDSKLQLFGVDIASSFYALQKQWKFYRISILENYGNEYENIFREFVMFGITQ